jgi:hypothetical protein
MSDLFIASLFADGVAHAMYLAYSGAALQWTGYVLNIVEVAAACAIFTQAYRKQIKPAMQKLAIATLVTLGALYYARPFVTGLALGGVSQRSGQPSLPPNFLAMPSSRLFSKVEIGANILLGIAGLAILLVDRDETESS